MKTQVLMVDDEPTVRMTIRYALDEAKFAVTEAESAEAALGLPKRAQFDLYLLDKNLPGISGVDLAKQLRMRDPAAAILLITGYATVDAAVEAMAAGADGFLEKPFDDIATVVERINEVVALAIRRRAAGPASASSQAKRLWVAGGADCSPVTHASATLPGVVVTAVADRDALMALLDLGPMPDMLLIDESLDASDYFGFLTQLIVRVPCVVAIKTRPSVDDADRCMRIGVKGLLAKPLSRPALDDRLKELLSQLRAP